MAALSLYPRSCTIGGLIGHGWTAVLLLLMPCVAAAGQAGSFSLESDTEGECCCCERSKTLFSWNCYVMEEDGEEEDDDTIVTDRPDFTEASSTVGLGRVQLEMGYTYTFDDEGPATRVSHTYPELLARIGMFEEWFEWRIVWNILDETAAGTTVGSEDMQLGIKLALTEQCCWLPEMALIAQMNVPTGIAPFTTGEVMPGVNWLYSWEVNEWLALGGSTQGNRVQDTTGHFHLEIAQSLTAAYSLSDRLGAYTEWYAFFPHSANDPAATPLHFFNGGFTWLAHDNLQYDVRAGLGLNSAADDYFIGTGLSVRY